MNESYFQWPKLVKKYINKEINDNELNELHEYNNTDPEKMRIFTQLTDREEFKKQFKYYQTMDTNKLWEMLEEKRNAASYRLIR